MPMESSLSSLSQKARSKRNEGRITKTRQDAIEKLGREETDSDKCECSCELNLNANR
jgi:hypothetical protein